MGREEKEYNEIFVPKYNVEVLEKTDMYVLANYNNNRIWFNTPDYYRFIYTINRAYELGSLPDFNYNLSINTFYILVDAGFNIIKEFEYSKTVDKDVEWEIDYRRSISKNKCFWGSLTGRNEVLVFATDVSNFLSDYKLVKDEEYNVKVLVQPDDKKYYESFFVYIKPNSSYKYPNHEIDTFFVLKKFPDRIEIVKKYIDEWVY